MVMMTTITSLRAVTLLLFLLFCETCANKNITDGHFENQTVGNNANNSILEVPPNQTIPSPSVVTQAPTSMIDPCQGSTFMEQDQMNIFEKDIWEYRHVICEDDTLTPCTPEASCCECKLVCLAEGSNCVMSGTPPIDDAPTARPTSKVADSMIPKSSGSSGITGSSGLDLIAILVSSVILLSCCINAVVILRKLRKRGLDYSRYPIPVDTADAVIQPGGKDDPVYVAKVKRHEDIICKFHFRTIHYRQIDDGSSRSLRSAGTNGSGETSGDLDCPTSPASVKRRLQIQKKRTSKLSFWRRQARKDECCICLENYGFGDTICVPIDDSCSHMFHEECVVAWLQHNNRCPLCRVDLMKESKVVDNSSSPSRSVTSPEAPAIAPAGTITINQSEEMDESHISESDDEEAQHGQGESNEAEEFQQSTEETVLSSH